jgi:signal transduction histidine kinase
VIASPPKTSRRGNLYGALAYASIALTCYAGLFLAGGRSFGSAGVIALLLILGAAYVATGVLFGSYADCDGRVGRIGYFALQCAILTAIVFISPSRGLAGILVLPAISQAIFNLRPLLAAGVGVYLFAINVVAWAIFSGWRGAMEGVMDYAAAFAFTVVFSVITKQAITAREREAKLRREVEAANALLRAHAAQAEEFATTRERNRVAREIHDGVGHYLTVVKTQLDAAAGLLESQPERARHAVTVAARLTADALDDLRRSVSALRTETARAPLPEALRMLSEEAGLPVKVRVEGEARLLPPGFEHALFRSAQEGLTNIRKHAGASAAEVALDFRQPDRVILAVTDNGKGAGEAKTGFGLLGIRERIEVLGGRVESGNCTGGGFALRVEVPA